VHWPAAIRSGWLDNQAGADAPSVAAAETVHYEAHGLVAGEIYRVQEGNGPGNAGPAKR
jgi:hypothetical protein